MKKFLMLSMLICGAMSGAWGATYNCKVQDIGMFSIKRSNEYLFVNTADYNHSNGRALVCGHMGTDGCDNGTKVFVTGHHYHAGNARTDSWFYECSSSGGNSWDAIGSTGFKKCSSTKGMRVITTVGSNDIYVPESAYNEYVSSGYYVSDSFCFYPHGTSTTQPVPVVKPKNCLTSGHKAGDTWDVDCKTLGITGGVKCGKRCNSDGSETRYVTQCQSNYRLDGKIWEGKYMRCVNVSGGGSGPSALERCLASRTTDEGKACCHLPETVAEWKDNECKCVTEGMEFKIENGRGKCVAKQTQPGETFKCNAELLALLDGWLVSCKNKPEIVSMINQIKVLCASSGVTAEAFNTLWSALLLLNPGECGTRPDLPPPPHVDDGADRLRVSIRIIRDAHSNLSGMAEGFKVSVWKDDEGKFNTSRLVSDSVAGVVLGTAGGLITSNVVKKNQVENGFEDLKCTIGGQVVADWGDQFRVGIQ